MEADRLVVGTVAKSFPIANEKLWVETPSNHGRGDNVIVAVCICSLGYVKKLPTFTRESNSKLSVASSKLGRGVIRTGSERCAQLLSVEETQNLLDRQQAAPLGPQCLIRSVG
jgi:hypothetical protein